MTPSTVSWALLIAVTVFGAVAQSAIGFGFALMAVPFFLLLLEVGDAVQSAMLLSFAITLVMAAKVRRDVPRRTAVNLLLGSVVGFPLGLVFFVHAGPGLIKATVAGSILLALAAGTHKARTSAALADTRLNGLIAGALSGAMVTSIAMPGPAIAIYMQAVGADKAKTRSTIFAVSFFSYLCAIFMHGYFHGIGVGGLKAAGWLLPLVLLGTWVGHRLSGLLSEGVFSRIISLMLLVVALYLLYSVLFIPSIP